ncbi:MAG: hypothetical protein E6J78_05180 [Deltaproteobacteria bacterium]|nr:MAG: hypothetical protein E6J78_05180 [Deltaproteobacteria bacterium]
MTTAKAGAPVGGFNHNVKYGAHIYHVQTEDSGLPHAHYITHLFLGGNIVASMKTSYAEKAGERDLQRVVRALMESQHKEMLRRLVGGEFNEMADRLASAHYEPGVLADGTNTASYVNTPAPPAGGFKPAPKPAPSRPTVKPVAPARPAPKPQQPIWQPSPPSHSPRTPGQPLPPTTRGPAQPLRPTSPPRMAPISRPPGSKQPAPTLFSESAVEMPHEDLPTLFAEELISEKSLDEVILAFLSAEEPTK